MKNLVLPTLISIAIVSLIFVFFEDLDLYFKNLMSQIQGSPFKYSIISFFVLSSDIILPVPSSIVMYTNGLILGIGYGFILSISSSLVSTSIGYALGKNTRFGAKKNEAQSNYFIQKYGGVAIIMSRGIPILSESISYTAGYNQVKFKNYFILNLIGYIPVCMIYSLFGSLGKNTNLFLYSFFLSIALSAIVWYFSQTIILSQK